MIQQDELHVSPRLGGCICSFLRPRLRIQGNPANRCCRCLAAGGFTSVFVVPNTKPVIDAKSQVEYIVQQSKSLPVQIIPIGAITRNAEGKELAEMYDMNNSGAVAFSDGLNPVQAAGILLKALQYIKSFNGVIIQVPDDKTIAPHGAYQ